MSVSSDTKQTPAWSSDSGNSYAMINDGAQRNHTQTPVAVVGMACRLPGHSDSPTLLWDFLQRGGIAKNEPPATRFSLPGHHDEHRRPRTMKSPGGMFMEDVDPEVFDGQFFNISRVDCIAMDPQQRILLEVAYECLENAGIPLEAISGKRVGCLVGTNIVDYASMQSRDPENRPESATIGVAWSILSNRISHFLNIHGPSMTVDSACSASLVGVEVACRYLDTHQADGMLVSGASLWLTPEHNEEIGMMRMTQSATGRCHSFDAKADGYAKAEGMNVVYLKRLDDALRDGDPIRAVIRGTATNSDGRTPGIASPSAEAQSAAIRAAYANAGIKNFNDTQYLECHGTGTPAGDPIEVRGAASVFAGTREPGQDLVIGSIKSNIGHSEAAAGLSGLMKVVLALEHGIIPGNPTFVTPNPNIDFVGSRVRPTRMSIKWPETSLDVRRASVNSFGFGGSNAHAILENAPFATHVSSYKEITSDFFGDDDGDEDAIVAEDAPSKVLVLSANDQSSLKSYISALSGHLINPGVSVDIDDLAYTLSERRSHHYYRAFLTTNSSSSIDQGKIQFGQKAASKPRVGFVFTGQGAQWPQMGSSLVKAFPQAREVIEELDQVLQKLPDPPAWSLLAELTEERTSAALRQPEYSQPLVTALQLAILEVVKDWGISPEAVVGHSSGEIAAAAAAGLITPDDAIKIAYYRGQATKKFPPKEPLGMLAVGVNVETVEKYMGPESKVQIACYNSPSSLTLSGTAAALKSLEERLKQDGHFARLLLVDAAYHSDYMAPIGEAYEKMLNENTNTAPSSPTARMFSSVTGQVLTEAPDAAYWKSNMVSPVRFTTAAKELLQDSQAAVDFLIEIGPSNALSGPIAQIKKTLSGAPADAQYTSALKRGPDSIQSLYNVAGQLFLLGGAVDLRKVNRTHESRTPSVIVDLPNYSWNHSQRYWHETQASRDWRFKKFINHDLLGSKMNGTAWQSPIFQKTLRLGDMPWLRDHMMGNQIIFPGAGYCAMAVEALYQVSMVTKWDGKEPSRYQFRFRDIRFLRALVLEEDEPATYTLTLTPARGGSIRDWFEFRVCSTKDTVYTEHCAGLISVETDYKETPAPSGSLKPLELATPASMIYKAVRESGYNYGPCFQKHLLFEATMGVTESRSTVSMDPPPSTYGQSFYPIHPASIDACFYIGILAISKGDIPLVGAVHVPQILSSLVIPMRREQPAEAIALASARFLGIGREDLHRNYGSDLSLYDPNDGSLIFEMKGLTTRDIETSEEEGAKHLFTHLAWEADLPLLLSAPEPKLRQFLRDNNKTTQDLIDLVAHKKPTLKVLEVNLSSTDASSLWVQEESNPIRAATSQYNFAVSDPATLISAQGQLSTHAPSAQFGLLDVNSSAAIVPDVKFDLVIVKTSDRIDTTTRDRALASISQSVEAGSIVISVGQGVSLSPLGSVQTLGDETSVVYVQSAEKTKEVALPTVSFISLTGTVHEQSSKILGHIIQSGWNVQKLADPATVTADQIVLVLDELVSPIMIHPDAKQWDTLKSLVQKQCRILWVTSGAHLDVTNPNLAAINGFFRSVRAEEGARLVNLDVERPEGDATGAAIVSCLDVLSQPDPKDQLESEFVERGGVVRVSRLLPDWEITRLQGHHPSDRKTEVLDIHASETIINMGAERLGDMDSIHYHEVTAEPQPLEDGYVEVEVYAAGLNYKDVVVTMGIVPGDERELGGEAAGIVTKVSPSVTSLTVGQRVVVFTPATISNRVRTRPGRVHALPDWMSFEEAATLCGVYLTSIYSLFDMADVKAGKTVLIHSAAGGVGISSMQLAQYAGAEVFATVGSPDKREFIKSTFGLEDDHIFNSRDTSFGDQILAATGGRGVDIILNSLTGDMLDESFRVLADGGIMVEIGKKDILDRNSLAMEPFDRNISLRAVDMSHQRAPDDLIARLMTKLFELLEGRHVKPINPIHIFSFTDVANAVRYLRAGKHIGKVVISDGPEPKISVPVRRAPKTLHFRDDATYLIVGGLRGLCGALAIYLAKSGAKHLAVISRSGHTDEKSRSIVKQVKALGSSIDLLTADVTSKGDVQRAFNQTSFPVGGIIQGAMVLRDRPFDSMTLEEYHQAVGCKIQGTWNLHDAAEKLGLELDFFTMLSSISGVIGQRGQANYAAANVFLDSFAAYRRQRGQAACSIDLGVIEDDGFIANNDGFQEKHFDSRTFKGINNGLLRQILYFSILQQAGRFPGSPSATQMVTGIVAPQPADSALLQDARFAALRTGSAGGRAAGEGGNSANADVQALLLLLKSKSAETSAQTAATVDVVNKCFVRMLRLSEPMDPARPLSVYGIDSLAAVEVRNWVRNELGALVTTVDIMNASSLLSFCEKIVSKIVVE
ncbi:beta-ketoacyl synthase domain-containing protein [Colletotrichum gloeosporioides Cg-14]|uniref:Beta-ketoacyl synthase domain-containing protein n=1 Tax=Colletotrichum gloeosporioides (strain Cg-14) TaxID=1237896 RepID=T0M1B7_COLGC|nr:beta-ketoacyl synthase domain-containing protein [Colletotrichum gloeosporioides Cg-14]